LRELGREGRRRERRGRRGHGREGGMERDRMGGVEGEMVSHMLWGHRTKDLTLWGHFRILWGHNLAKNIAVSAFKNS
jgi:hypothetical protein